LSDAIKSGPKTLISRRALFAAGGAAALAGTGLLTFSLGPAARAQKGRQGPQEVALDELMRPGELPELAVGTSDAKVVIVEYASMTCGHCATFHAKVFPELKQKYIDTGKVRFILREFPLDNLAAAASMLARCAGGDKTYPLVGVLFEKQDEWVVRGNPVPRLFEIAKQAGFTQESFDKCLTDQKLLEQISAVRTRANEKFGVTSTPTFFINGKRLSGGSAIADFDQAIEPLLKS
jgi:protein-disulfide isomerase